MSWVLFDYGCVVSLPQPDADVAELAAAARSTPADLQEPYWRWRHAYDLGDLDGRQYWDLVGSVLGARYGAAELAELIRLDARSWLHLAAGTVALAGDLAAAGQRLALLSNAPAEIASGIAALPELRRFEHLLFSCDLRAAKPDPRCYQLALGQLGARAGEVIFLDDRPGNVAGAAGAGIRAVHFTSPDQARGELQALLADGQPAAGGPAFPAAGS